MMSYQVNLDIGYQMRLALEFNSPKTKLGRWTNFWSQLSVCLVIDIESKNIKLQDLLDTHGCIL